MSNMHPMPPLSRALLATAITLGLCTAAVAGAQDDRTQQTTSQSPMQGTSGSQSQSTMQQRGMQQGQQLTQADRQFVDKVVQANAVEVAMGKLAQDKGGERVKQYGKTLVEDHKKALDKLASISPGADRKQVSIDQMHQQQMDELAGLSGNAFDRKFITMMEKDHQKTIDLFRQAANDQQNSQQIRQYAQQTLPTLEQHLQTAQQIDEQVGRVAATDEE